MSSPLRRSARLAAQRPSTEHPSPPPTERPVVHFEEPLPHYKKDDAGPIVCAENVLHVAILFMCYIFIIYVMLHPQLPWQN